MDAMNSKVGWRQWSVVAATIGAVFWVSRHVKQVFVTPPTVKEAREIEKGRQKGIRRKMRGLKRAA